MSNDYPVTYVKGDQERRAQSVADETKLKFDGFRPKRDAVAAEIAAEDPSYADLQARAKVLQNQEHYLSAVGTHEELLAAVSNAQADQDEIEDLQ